MLTFRKCHNLQNSLLIIKKVFIWCYSAGQIQNKKSIREYLKGLKRQPLSRENKGHSAYYWRQLKKKCTEDND